MFNLSVIIPVRNEEKHIAEVLERLLEQETSDGTVGTENNAMTYEILVADGCSTDGTRGIVSQFAAKHPNIRLLENPKRLSSAARNIGIQNAEGRYILVVDGHCIIDNRRMLVNAVQAFETSQADCLARPQPLEMQHATALQWAIASARRSPLGHNPDSLIYSTQAQFAPASSAAIAYRKSVFEKIGYFDENFDACEDVELNTRIDKAGLKCWFDPAIAVRYVPRKTLSGLFYQLYRYGRGRVRLFRKHRETFSPTMFALGLFVFCFIAGLILLPLCYGGLIGMGINNEPVLWVYLWRFGLGGSLGCILIPYTMAVLGESLHIAVKQKNIKMLPYLPFVFCAIHFGFGFGILRELWGASKKSRKKPDTVAGLTQSGS